MKKKSIYLSGLLMLMFTAAACEDEPRIPARPVEPEPPVVTLPGLKSPQNPLVAVKEARSVVVVWTGDDTATSYQVDIANQILETTGTSCGTYNVQAETDYTWRVRAIRERDTTAWVPGPPFRTPTFTDPRDKWLGTWTSSNTVVKADISGFDVPLDQFADILSSALMSQIESVLEFELSKLPSTGPTTDYDALGIAFPLLSAFGLPQIASITLEEDETFWMDEQLNIPLSYPGLPLDISEVALLGNIPQLSSVQGVMINKLQVTLTNLQLTAGPIAGDQMPFKGVIYGDVVIETGDNMINAGIAFLKPRLKIILTSDVGRTS